MFDRLKKAFARDAQAVRDPRAGSAPGAAGPASTLLGPVSEWAGTQGLSVSGPSAGSALGLQGSVGGRPWRAEVGRPARKYIRGQELRMRAELDIDPGVLVMVMNRPLKEALEKQAYALYTDDVRTSADPNLPEEMRLLAMYQEVGWDELPRSFWHRWSVVADDRARAPQWVDAPLARLLADWPAPLPPATPVLLLLLRGKAYLRMELQDGEPALLQHACTVFTSACENALDAFTTPG